MSRKPTRILSCLIGFCILSGIFPLRAASMPLPSHTERIALPCILRAFTMTLPSQIFRKWMHSREEDMGDTIVYRPSDYPFPPARGRDGLEFRNSGEFILYRIGAADGSDAVPGQWSVQEDNVVQVEFPNQSPSPYKLTILECNDQILKVKQTAGS